METSGCAEVVEVIAGRYFFLHVSRPEQFRTNRNVLNSVCYCIDNELLYLPFHEDFGPLNLGLAYRFCRRTEELLQEAGAAGKRLCFYTGPSEQAKANAAVLVGMFQVIMLGRTPRQACTVLQPLEPFVPFRDASHGRSLFDLTVPACLGGVAKAVEAGFIDWGGPECTFDLHEYEHYEQVQNGDLNWIIPGKLLAFSGPASTARVNYGVKMLTPEDYWPLFQSRGISTVVRLNKAMYDAKRFTRGGFSHVELYFPDGHCPSMPLLQRFLALVETTPGALAIHCKAGLGRTGVLICSYLIKHHGFSAEEAIGYIRVCRPGSVIGPQQTFLVEIEAQLVREGLNHHMGRLDLPSSKGRSQDAKGLTGARSGSGRQSFSLTASSATLAPALPPSPSSLGPSPSRNRSISLPTSLHRLSSGSTTRAALTVLAETPASRGLYSSDMASGDRRSTVDSALSGKRPLTLKELSAVQQRHSLVSLRSGGVARALAPNGQPRKVPAGLLLEPQNSCDISAFQEEDGDVQYSSQGWTIGSATKAL